MALQTIGLGTSPNDGTGDSIRVGGDKINDNFVELYNLLGDGTTLGDATFSNLTIDANAGSSRTFGVGDTTNTTLILQGGGNGFSGPNIKLGLDGNNYYDASTHIFRSIALSELMRVDAFNSRVGIGTSSPSATLEVAGAPNATIQPSNAIIKMNSSGGNGLYMGNMGAATYASYIQAGFVAADSPDVDYNLLLQPNGGNVGIGTSSPIYKLDVDSGTADIVARLVSSDTNAFIDIRDATTAAGAVRYGAVGDNAVLWAGLSERMRIDSSGNVGIGTNSPSKTLDVNGQLRIRNGGATGYALLEYGASATATNNWHVGSEGDGTYRFYNGNFGAGTERIRIDSSGNVGIGIGISGTDPRAPLHVQPGGPASDNFNVLVSQYRPNIVLEDLSDSSTDFQIFVDANAFQIRSGDASTDTKLASEHMRIDSSGKVGIGTSSPAAALHVVKSYITNVSLTWGATAGQIFRNENSELAIGLEDTSPFPLYMQGRTNINTARDIVINPLGGNVGIGTTAPGEKLNVNTGSSEYAIQWNSTGSNNWVLASASNRAYIANKSTPLEVLTLLNGGNVGIGTTTPDGKLHVLSASAGSVTATADGDELVVEGNLNTGISILSPDLNNTGVYFGSASDNLGAQILWNRTNNRLLIGTDNASAEIHFYVGANSRVATLDSSGNLLIGTTTSGASKLVVADDSIQVNTAKTPASASATGTTGQIAWDASYIYVCTATNTWRRVAHGTW